MRRNGTHHLRRAQVLLAVDPVLTDAQLLRQQALHDHLPARAVTLRVRPKSVTSTVHVTFRSLDAGFLRRHTPEYLAHLAGTAELRLALEWPLAGWRNEARRMGDVLSPDAVFEDGQRKVLLEYDSGAYSARTVRRKIRAFREDGEVVWGTTSALRQARLQLRYPDVRVLRLDWWSPPDAP